MHPFDAASTPPDSAPGAAGTVDRSQRLENLQALNFSHLLYFWAVARDGSIASACEKLHVSQPTISMQIRKLERSLAHRLFDRSGRNLVLTDVGRTVYEYADEMFATGRELLATLRGLPGKRSSRLVVGIPVYLPKLIVHRLLEPVLQLPERVQLICHVAELSELFSGMAKHRFDAILTDTPLQSTIGVRCYNHPLGECDLAICGHPALARRHRERFPDSLDGCPLLLPTVASAMRRSLDRWFDERPYNPQVIAEFDDSSLMKEFASAGLFPAPSAVLPEIIRQYGVELVGRLPEVRVSYYVVTADRKLTHPATVVIADQARTGLLDDPAP
ncbi:MAG TPA: LysR family transcriptional regulator [Lacipirellulaceae bacterium]|nr:LysR family transcriptional regulator [Lacipirellulaceae bacterium]HMP05354.1 LysR family transcriptional regulator [Lacipirellulaceae bacterium]